jgi:beta-phosphoglucomutase-like phosphatase (HAD superfamily)
VFFDVDGTLVDSERDGHRVAFNRAFAEFDLPYRWDDETYGRLAARPISAEKPADSKGFLRPEPDRGGTPG